MSGKVHQHFFSGRTSVSLKVLDLFAGIGGFSLGLERTGGFETVGFCEIDKKAQLVLKKHWPDVPIWDDIKELSSEWIEEACGCRPEVIVGGFPCQDISNAGKGKGIIGERSGLWSEMFRLIADVRPAWAIIENVSALRSKGLALVLQDLSSIGYCAEWHCIPASAVGAPHRRDRIWIVAYPMCKHSSQRGERQTAASQGGSGGTYPRRSQSDAQRERSVRGPRCSTTEDVAYTRRIPAQVSLEGRFPAIQVVERDTWWEIEPSVGRVADGVPNRLDRLKQLGNAVVPQIPELLGRAILSTYASDGGQQCTQQS